MLLMRDVMTRELATLNPGASVSDALSLCREQNVRHVPVVENGKLAGIISDRDIDAATPPEGDPSREEKLRELTVADLMSSNVATAHPQDPIGFAAQEMYERKINALPVMLAEEGKNELVGIVTSTDVMRALVTMTGVHEPGSQIQVQAPDRPGVLADVAEIIRDLEVDILSALSSPEKRSGGRNMIFRLTAEDPSTVVQSLQMAGYSVSWITIPRRSS